LFPLPVGLFANVAWLYGDDVHTLQKSSGGSIARRSIRRKRFMLRMERIEPQYVAEGFGKHLIKSRRLFQRQRVLHPVIDVRVFSAEPSFAILRKRRYQRELIPIDTGRVSGLTCSSRQAFDNETPHPTQAG
jgi:hypothetical protein